MHLNLILLALPLTTAAPTHLPTHLTTLDLQPSLRCAPGLREICQYEPGQSIKDAGAGVPCGCAVIHAVGGEREGVLGEGEGVVGQGVGYLAHRRWV